MVINNPQFLYLKKIFHLIQSSVIKLTYYKIRDKNLGLLVGCHDIQKYFLLIQNAQVILLLTLFTKHIVATNLPYVPWRETYPSYFIDCNYFSRMRSYNKQLLTLPFFALSCSSKNVLNQLLTSYHKTFLWRRWSTAYQENVLHKQILFYKCRGYETLLHLS